MFSACIFFFVQFEACGAKISTIGVCGCTGDYLLIARAVNSSTIKLVMHEHKKNLTADAAYAACKASQSTKVTADASFMTSELQIEFGRAHDNTSQLLGRGWGES